MTNEELADELIRRLNALIETPDVRDFVQAVIDQRVPVSAVVAEHPTVQVGVHDGVFKAGLLGLLNGIVGTIADGSHSGWGHIAAIYSDDKKLLRFQRTEEMEKRVGSVDSG